MVFASVSCSGENFRSLHPREPALRIRRVAPVDDRTNSLDHCVDDYDCKKGYNHAVENKSPTTPRKSWTMKSGPRSDMIPDCWAREASTSEVSSVDHTSLSQRARLLTFGEADPTLFSCPSQTPSSAGASRKGGREGPAAVRQPPGQAIGDTLGNGG